MKTLLNIIQHFTLKFNVRFDNFLLQNSIKFEMFPCWIIQIFKGFDFLMRKVDLKRIYIAINISKRRINRIDS